MAPTHVKVGQRRALADLEPATEPVGRDGKPALTEDDRGIVGAVARIQQTDQVQPLVRDLPDTLVAAVQTGRLAGPVPPEVDVTFVQVALQRQALKPLGAAVEQQHFLRLRRHLVPLAGTADGCRGGFILRPPLLRPGLDIS